MKTTAKGILTLKRKMEKLLIIISFSLLNDKWHKSTLINGKYFPCYFPKLLFIVEILSIKFTKLLYQWQSLNKEHHTLYFCKTMIYGGCDQICDSY